MTNQAEAKLEAKIKAMGTSALKDVAILATLNTTDESDIVFAALMTELGERLTDDQYIAFCDELDDLLDQA